MSEKRPFTTDYGVTQGHCATPQGAIKSALKHLMLSGSKRCVIECDDGKTVDVWYNGYFGVIVEVRKRERATGQNVVKFPRKKRA